MSESTRPLRGRANPRGRGLILLEDPWSLQARNMQLQRSISPEPDATPYRSLYLVLDALARPNVALLPYHTCRGFHEFPRSLINSAVSICSRPCWKLGEIFPADSLFVS